MVLEANLQPWLCAFQPCAASLVTVAMVLNNRLETIGAKGLIHER